MESINLPVDPTSIIAEVLGNKAVMGANPSDDEYICPCINSRCTKRGGEGTVSYPVCSILKRDNKYVCVCPKRFHEIDFLADIVSQCWPGDVPKNPKIAREVKMRGFGNVDFVIADVNQENVIDQFLSVELQAVDITGSVRSAYDAILENEYLEKRPVYNLNMDNVYKRYITQLIRKGYFHHHWGTKIVSVLQDVVYENIRERYPFTRQTDIHDSTINVIFLSYKFKQDDSGAYYPSLHEVEGTSHANLHQASLYAQPLDRDKFCQRILTAINR